MYSFPVNEKLWQQHAQIHNDSLRNERGLADATEFYRVNQIDMDHGAAVAWPERFNPDDLSAIQHAMNLKLENEAAFIAEYQNQPLGEQELGADLLKADQICHRINRQDYRRVPQAAARLSAIIDVEPIVLRRGFLERRFHRSRH